MALKKPRHLSLKVTRPNKDLQAAVQGRSNWDSKGHRRNAPHSAPGFRTADQSCERQERDLAAFAARAGYEVVGTYKETASGVRLDRAERKCVLALAQRRELDAVLVTELSRWRRGACRWSP